MFSYFGSKSKLLQHYPPPSVRYEKVIEPFAGSARYALKYFENDVYLYDLSPYVVEVWKYLIQASRNDVLGLPDVPSGVDLRDAFPSLTDAETWLIGFCLARGRSIPRKKGHGMNSWNVDKVRIANDLYKIRHWHIEQKSYLEIPNEPATYFIDPAL